MKLKFDHAFTADLNHAFLNRMKKLGFVVSATEVEHPGQLFCRFVTFRENLMQLPVYLEFIHWGNHRKPVRWPGLSLRSLGSLERHVKILIARGLDVHFEHKNYDWKVDAKNRLAGWNFVNFKNTGVRSLYTWITEYEKPPGFEKIRSRVPVQKHPNSVKRIIGVEVQLSPAGKVLFRRLFGRELGRSLRLPEGQTLWFSGGRFSRLTRIILECQSLKQMRKYPVDGECIWHGRPGLVINNPSGMWDLVVVQE